MKRYVLPILAGLLAAGFTSCHKDDVEEPEDDCLWDLSLRHPVTISLDVDPSLSFYKDVRYDVDAELDDVQDVKASRTARSGCELRYVVNVYKTNTRQLVATKVSSTPTFTMELPVGKMQVLAWADYAPVGLLQDEYFLTDDFRELIVADKYPYTANCFYKQASWGMSDMTIAYNTTSIPIRMSTVMSQIQIIATDEPKETVAKIRVSYPTRVPCAINGFTGDVCYSWAGVWFDSTPVEVNNGEVLLAYDYIPCNREETIVPIRIDMTDADGKIVARSLNIDVPIRRGGITEVRAPFYSIVQQDNTNPGGGTSGGISIDPNFEDEIIIELH